MIVALVVMVTVSAVVVISACYAARIDSPRPPRRRSQHLLEKEKHSGYRSGEMNANGTRTPKGSLLMGHSGEDLIDPNRSGCDKWCA